MTIKEKFKETKASNWKIVDNNNQLGPYESDLFYNNFHKTKFWSDEPKQILTNYTKDKTSVVFILN